MLPKSLFTHPWPSTAAPSAHCLYESIFLLIGGLCPIRAPPWGPAWRSGFPIRPLFHVLKFISTATPSIFSGNPQLRPSAESLFTLTSLSSQTSSKDRVFLFHPLFVYPLPPSPQESPWHTLIPEKVGLSLPVSPMRILSGPFQNR